MFQTNSALSSLLKEVWYFISKYKGHRHYSGLEESILKNIDAVKEISKMTRSSLGPLGILYWNIYFRS